MKRKIFSILFALALTLTLGMAALPTAGVEADEADVRSFSGAITGGGQTSDTLIIGDNASGPSSLTGSFAATITGNFVDGTYSVVADNLNFSENMTDPAPLPYVDTQDFIGAITIAEGQVTIDGTLTPGFNTGAGDTHTITSVNANFSNGLGSINITTIITYGTYVVEWTVAGTNNVTFPGIDITDPLTANPKITSPWQGIGIAFKLYGLTGVNYTANVTVGSNFTTFPYCQASPFGVYYPVWVQAPGTVGVYDVKVDVAGLGIDTETNAVLVTPTGSRVDITYPLTANPKTTSPDQIIDIQFRLYDLTTRDVLTNVTIGTTAKAFTCQASPEGVFNTVQYTVPQLAAGLYNLTVEAGGLGSDTELRAIQIDTGAPTGSISVANNCWSTQAGDPNRQAGIPESYAINYSFYKAGSNSLTCTFEKSFGDGWSPLTSKHHTASGSATLYCTPTYWLPDIVCLGWWNANITAQIRMKVTDDTTGLQSDWQTVSFNIYDASQLSASVTYPNTPGLSFDGGSSITIQGTVNPIPTHYLLALSRDGTDTNTENITSGWKSIAAGSGTRTWSTAWTVSTTTASANCYILAYVKDCAGNESVTKSAYPFKIVPTTGAKVTIQYPTSGTVWYSCARTDNITFTLTGGTVTETSCAFAWSSDNNTWHDFYYSVYPAGKNSYIWDHSSLGLTGTLYIRITATNNGVPTDGYSPAFTVKTLSGGPTISLEAWDCGDSLTGGTTCNIKYKCTEAGDTTAPMEYYIYLIDYSPGGSTSEQGHFVARNANGSAQSYSWAVPNVTGANYKIKIVVKDPCGNEAFAESAAPFSITESECGDPIQYDIPLKTGWNLISFPLMPISTDIRSILSGVTSNINVVYYYANGIWYTYIPGVTDTLSTMSDGKAYWIHSKADSTLTLVGRKCPCGGGAPIDPYTYHSGYWCMVGFKSTVPQPLNSYMPYTCGNQYAVPIYSYDATTQEMTSLGCTDNLTPGQGYWMYFAYTIGVNPGCK